MATWKLSPQYKKSAVEKMFFYKEGKCITVEQGFRWATFTVESDVRPLTDEELKNEDGYELGCIDNDECWEMWDMIDGCWVDIKAENDKTTAEDLAEFEQAWEEDSYSGVEELEWMNDDTEYYYFGPLELTNDDTGEVFQGEPDSPIQDIDPDASIPLEFLVESEPDPEPTEWYPVKVNPVRKGLYECETGDVQTSWPYPKREMIMWSGRSWKTKEVVLQWRGLNKEVK